jgi:lipoprotein-anchoring transpeptidase ErfK/SrfK
MITLASFERKIRRAAVAIGALLAGAFSFAHPAAATPLPLFPFFMAPPVQSEPAPYVQSPQMDDERSAIEQPARFRRQIVNYPTREAAGTIIVDTQNKFCTSSRVTAGAFATASASAVKASNGMAAPASASSANGRPGHRRAR